MDPPRVSRPQIQPTADQKFHLWLVESTNAVPEDMREPTLGFKHRQRLMELISWQIVREDCNFVYLL